MTDRLERKIELIYEIMGYFLKDYEEYDPEEMFIDAEMEYIGIEGYEETEIEEMNYMDLETVEIIHKRFFQINK